MSDPRPVALTDEWLTAAEERIATARPDETRIQVTNGYPTLGIVEGAFIMAALDGASTIAAGFRALRDAAREYREAQVAWLDAAQALIDNRGKEPYPSQWHVRLDAARAREDAARVALDTLIAREVPR